MGPNSSSCLLKKFGNRLLNSSSVAPPSCFLALFTSLVRSRKLGNILLITLLNSSPMGTSCNSLASASPGSPLTNSMAILAMATGAMSLKPVSSIYSSIFSPKSLSKNMSSVPPFPINSLKTEASPFSPSAGTDGAVILEVPAARPPLPDPRIEGIFEILCASPGSRGVPT